MVAHWSGMHIPIPIKCIMYALLMIKKQVLIDPRTCYSHVHTKKVIWWYTPFSGTPNAKSVPIEGYLNSNIGQTHFPTKYQTFLNDCWLDFHFQNAPSSEFSKKYQINMLIFHSYVKLPERAGPKSSIPNCSRFALMLPWTANPWPCSVRHWSFWRDILQPK